MPFKTAAIGETRQCVMFRLILLICHDFQEENGEKRQSYRHHGTLGYERIVRIDVIFRR